MHLIVPTSPTSLQNIIGRELEAEIVVLHHATSVQVGF
jgi:GTPase